MSIVIDTPYRSTLGRKPSRPAFNYGLHNDAAGGTAIVDRFGNAPNLTVNGALGTFWTASRGFGRPSGSANQLTPAAAAWYAGQSVLGGPILTAGKAVVLGWLVQWPSAKSTSSEVVLCLGRNNANSAAVLIGHGGSANGYIEMQHRGSGASTTTYNTFGAGAVYTVGPVHACCMHLQGTAAGIEAVAFLDGVQVGTLRTLSWADNGGSKPSLATFGSDDTITLLSSRVGADPGAPTWSQRVGGGNTGGTAIADVWAVNIDNANLGLAQDLALEAHQYRRAIGSILASI